MNIRTGRKIVTTAGTRVQLSATNRAVKKIIISAETDNTGYVTVGESAVIGATATRIGTPIAPVFAGAVKTCESQIELCDVDLFDIWLDSTVNGDGVTYTYFY